MKTSIVDLKFKTAKNSESWEDADFCREAVSDPDFRELAEVSSYFELIEVKKIVEEISDWGRRPTAFKEVAGDDPTEKKKEQAYYRDHADSLKMIKTLEEHESVENLDESISEALNAAVMKVRLPYTKKFREACVFKKKNMQMVRTEVEEIIRKKMSLDGQEEDQAFKTARIELQEAARDLYKDLGNAISFVAKYKRDISACLCGEPMKGFGCYGSNFNELLKKLPEWVLPRASRAS